MASRGGSSSQDERSETSASRRNSKEVAAQYVTGKKFKVKCLGSRDISDFRGGDALAADVMKQLRQESSRLKATKLKATITLKFKGLTVFDEKSKIISLNVPIEKVKFVCHDHQDITVFAAIIQIDRPGDAVGYKLHAYQADQKVAVSFVRSSNELFTILYKMMKAKRRMRSQESTSSSMSRQDSSSSTGSQGRRQSGSERRESGDPVKFSITGSENTSVEEDEPVILGFGIPAPPPSYKAAVKNTDVYKVPENTQVKPVVLAPPPKSVSGSKLPAGSSRRTRTVIQPLPRAQTTPTLSSADDSGSRIPALPGPQSVPRPTTTRTVNITNTQRSGSVQNQVQTASVTPQAIPQEPSVSVVQSSNLGQAQVQPLQTQQVESVSPQQPPTGQENGRQDVWGEWRTLEGQLQDLAEEVGLDMSSSANVANVSAQSSLSNDPFADNFFETSFGSPTAFNGQGQQRREDANQFNNSGSFFGSFDNTGTDSTSQIQGSGVITDPFSPIVPLTGQTSPPPNGPLSPIHSNNTSTANDSFAQTSVPLQTSSPIVTSAETRDPFSQLGSSNVTPLSTTTSINSSNPVLSSAWMLDNAQSMPKTVARVDSFDTDFAQSSGFSQSSGIQPMTHTSSGSKRGSLLPAPPPAKLRSGTTSSRPRPRPRDSIDEPLSVLAPTSPASNMDPFQVQSSSIGVSPESSAFSSDFNLTNFTSDNDSTLQLSNPLYLSPLTNSGSLQGTQALNTSNGIPGLNELHTLTAEVSGSSAQTTSPPVIPIVPNWSSDNFQPQVSPPMQQQAGALVYDQAVPAMQQSLQQSQVFPFGDPASQLPVPQDPGNMAYQFLPQDPSFSPQFVVPLDPSSPQFVSNPAQEGGALFSSTMSDSFPLSGNNPFAGDFESPPFAVHSSTPQTPNRKENGSYVYPNSSSPIKPSTVSVLDGPDPFANLLPLALSPPKENKTAKAVESTKSSKNSNATQEKRPTLNELFTKRNSFQALDEDEHLAIGTVTSKPANKDNSTTSLSEGKLIELDIPQGSGDVNDFQDSFLLGEVEQATGSTKTHSFDENFGLDSASTWVAF